MITAHLDRLEAFLQHGEPKDYRGSDMMMADVKATLETLKMLIEMLGDKK